MGARYDFVSIPLYALGEGIVGDIKKITFGLGRRYLVVVDNHIDAELQRAIAGGFERPLAQDFAPGENMLGRAAGLMDDLGVSDLGEQELTCEFLQFAPKACTKRNAQELGAEIALRAPDVVVAVGGGKCLDLVRAGLHFCGEYMRPKLVMVPSVITTNACANGISIMYDEAGQMCDFWNLALPPECVIVDTALIAQAPHRFLAAAIGDQVSSSIEALHTFDYLGLRTSVDPFAAAHHETVLEVLEEHAVSAVESVRCNTVSPSLEFVCHALTRYTGPQLSVATSFVSHVLDEALISIPKVAGRMHGEVVAFGVLPEMVLFGTPEEMWRWADIYGKIGLPRTLSELGIPDANYNDILTACEGATDKIMASRALVHWTPDQMAESVMEADRLVREHIETSL